MAYVESRNRATSNPESRREVLIREETTRRQAELDAERVELEREESDLRRRWQQGCETLSESTPRPSRVPWGEAVTRAREEWAPLLRRDSELRSTSLQFHHPAHIPPQRHAHSLILERSRLPGLWSRRRQTQRSPAGRSRGLSTRR